MARGDSDYPFSKSTGGLVEQVVEDNTRDYLYGCISDKTNYHQNALF
jgi:hypothetical protein